MQELGNIEGKVILFGGVYSNLQALEALLKEADKLGVPYSNLICTGDIIGYCAQPEEVSQLMRKHNIRSIAGNVEQQLREEEEDCGCDFEEGTTCDSLSKTWYPYAQIHISEETKSWLDTIPLNISFTFGNKKCVVVHGSYFNISEFVFKSSPWETKDPNFAKTEADVIIAGHCGLPFVDRNENKTWLNPGVIGMPANDGNTTVWYATLEVVNGEIEMTHHSLAYDFNTAASLMVKAQLPSQYSLTLKTGIWDNCDILPEEETKNQGKEIDF